MARPPANPRPAQTFRSPTPSACHDFTASLPYTKVSPDTGEALGPFTWGKTDFDAAFEELVDVVVRDARGHEDEFDLDAHGFCFARHASSLGRPDFDSERTIRQHYYPEVEAIVKQVTGASKVVFIHHTLRSSNPPSTESRKLTRPLNKVHVDSSGRRIEQSIRAIFPDADAQRLLARRYAMINIWRPLQPVCKDPLALCDGASVAPSDYVYREIALPHRAHRQENMGVRASPAHRWWFLSAQDPAEIVILKCWDSRPDVVQRCPHAGIYDPANNRRVQARESIEVRTLAFWDD